MLVQVQSWQSDGLLLGCFDGREPLGFLRVDAGHRERFETEYVKSADISGPSFRERMPRLSGILPCAQRIGR